MVRHPVDADRLLIGEGQGIERLVITQWGIDHVAWTYTHHHSRHLFAWWVQWPFRGYGYGFGHGGIGVIGVIIIILVVLLLMGRLSLMGAM